MGSTYVRLLYLYRDAANNRAHDYIYVQNDLNLSTQQVADSIRDYLIHILPDSDIYHFNPVQIGVPPLHVWHDIWDFDPNYDHSVHELWLDSIEIVELEDLYSDDGLDEDEPDEGPDRPRTISELIERIRNAYREGWVFPVPGAHEGAVPCRVYLYGSGYRRHQFSTITEGMDPAGIVPIDSLFECSRCGCRILEIRLPYNAHQDDSFRLYVRGFLPGLSDLSHGIVVEPGSSPYGEYWGLPCEEFPAYFTFCSQCRREVALAELEERYRQVQQGLLT